MKILHTSLTWKYPHLSTPRLWNVATTIDYALDDAHARCRCTDPEHDPSPYYDVMALDLLQYACADELRRRNAPLADPLA